MHTREELQSRKVSDLRQLVREVTGVRGVKVYEYSKEQLIHFITTGAIEMPKNGKQEESEIIYEKPIPVVYPAREKPVTVEASKPAPTEMPAAQPDLAQAIAATLAPFIKAQEPRINESTFRMIVREELRSALAGVRLVMGE